MKMFGKLGKVVLFLTIITFVFGGAACSKENAALGAKEQKEPMMETLGEKNDQPAVALEPKTVSETGEDSSTSTVMMTGAINQFSFDLYAYLKKEETGNIFYSPFSLSVAMAMTYEGARGETAAEIRQVFHYPEDITLLRKGLAEIISAVNKEDKKYELRTANALWAQKNYPFLPEYFQTVQRFYDGRGTNVDFVGDTENSRLTINRWVEEQTNKKIKDLIPRKILTSSTRLVLTNAIYFKGLWERQFPKNATQKADFRVSANKTVKVPMMFLQDVEVNYFENEDLQVVELPYLGGDISMLILLPRKDLPEIESYLSAEKIEALRGKLNRKEKVDIYLPRFKLENKYLLGGENEVLGKMGMPTAFTMEADLSGMTGRQELYISEVVHQGFVDVNEEGTEAAAATAVIIDWKMLPEKLVFRADHPFIFMIQEKKTGAILFLGRVVDPTSSE